ncbi:MAG TPA: 50S ribosomal protein L15 [Syntrophales bacterium]|nr:50S ribosomal protein L15 [Syntrophales bacterium]
MNLSSLKPPAGSRKKRKRIGRGDGSGHGGTSTKGHKGQNARSGGKTRAGFEGGQMPLSRRLPKRGFRNPFRKKIVIVNIEELKRFPSGSVIDREALLAAGLIKKAGDGIKVLAKGNIDHAVSLKVDMISRAAKDKIEAAGGSVVEVI